ncbi:DeoR family transcriptional regulator, partial [Pseudomonas amygdali pv. photiniae]
MGALDAIYLPFQHYRQPGGQSALRVEFRRAAHWSASGRATLCRRSGAAVLCRCGSHRAMGSTLATDFGAVAMSLLLADQRPTGPDTGVLTLQRNATPMLNQPRLDEIMRLLAQQQRVKASDLAQLLFVSEETIRRDFKYLEEEGRLRRIHGGAILPRSSEELPLQERSRLKPRAKAGIAARAAQLVSEGMAIFLDTGTSTLALAQQLTRFSQLKIITNSLDIAQLISHQSDNQVLVAPGDVR